jgi:hypothetical protein
MTTTSEKPAPTFKPNTMPSIPEAGDPALLLKHPVTPMEAVNILYSDGACELTEAIAASLSRQVFDAPPPKPAAGFKRLLGFVSFQLLKRTTSTRTETGHDGQQFIAYQNSILERSKHPYAQALLETSDASSASFVEGGDPMNAPYMMISPEIRSTARTWDRLLLDSVQGKDVQLRFTCEAQATLEAAKRRLEEGRAVRLKAAAAGTGLSMILVFDRLIREGYDPAMITMVITDRCATNITKIERLLGKLASTRNHLAQDGKSCGISARTEDLLAPESNSDDPYQVVTLIGILEYFHGHTSTTTEEHLGHPNTNLESCAKELAHAIAATTSEHGTLIANTYRVEVGARILEIFGKKFRYRDRANLHTLVGLAGFVPTHTAGSGHVYDVEVFEKRPKQ